MTNLRKGLPALIGIVALSALASCAQSEGPKGGTASPAAATIEGKWSSAEAGEPYLEFADDDSVTGTDGCNVISTSYSVEGTTLTLEPFTSTMKACSGVDPWLSDVSTAEIDGESMAILDNSGETIGTLTKE